MPRPSKISKARARKLRAAGLSTAAIAAELDCSAAYVRRIAPALPPEPEPEPETGADDPYRCQLCDETFGSDGALARHEASEHSAAPSTPDAPARVHPDGGPVRRGKRNCYAVPLEACPPLLGYYGMTSVHGGRWDGCHNALVALAEYGDIALDSRGDGETGLTISLPTSDGHRRRFVVFQRGFIQGVLYESCDSPAEIRALYRARRLEEKSPNAPDVARRGGVLQREVTIGDTGGARDHGQLFPIGQS